MSLKRCGRKLLDQPSGWITVGAQTPLLDHHIALFVKLAHYWVYETLRLEIGPQFEPVGWQRVVIGSFVVAGAGIEILPAVLLDELAKFVGLDVLIGLGDSILPSLFEFLQLRFVTSAPLIALLDVSGIRSLNFCQRDLFGRVIGRTNLVRPLEGHVLEHVSQA